MWLELQLLPGDGAIATPAPYPIPPAPVYPEASSPHLLLPHSLCSPTCPSHSPHHITIALCQQAPHTLQPGAHSLALHQWCTVCLAAVGAGLEQGWSLLAQSRGWRGQRWWGTSISWGKMLDLSMPLDSPLPAPLQWWEG